MNKTTKEQIEKLQKACDLLDAAGIGFAAFGGDSSTQECFQNDFLAFLMYLSSADRIVSQEEAEAMNDFLGLENVSPQQYAKLINSMGIHSDKFAKTVPSILKLFANADIQLAEMNAPILPPLSSQVCSIYEAAGMELLSIDRTIDRKEAANLGKYLRMMRDYTGKALTPDWGFGEKKEQ